MPRDNVIDSKHYAVGFMASLFIPVLTALVFDYESWPLTSAPMFAHYHDQKVPLYRFKFVGIFPNAAEQLKEREMHPKSIGWSGMWFDFHFFGHVYGSIDAESPFGKHRSENRSVFEGRLTHFFQTYLEALRRAKKDPAAGMKRMRLEVIRLDVEARDQETHAVGTFDVDTGVFVHQWVDKQWAEK